MTGNKKHTADRGARVLACLLACMLVRDSYQPVPDHPRASTLAEEKSQLTASSQVSLCVATQQQVSEAAMKGGQKRREGSEISNFKFSFFSGDDVVAYHPALQHMCVLARPNILIHRVRV